jgi:hypothetical protein
VSFTGAPLLGATAPRGRLRRVVSRDAGDGRWSDVHAIVEPVCWSHVHVIDKSECFPQARALAIRVTISTSVGLTIAVAVRNDACRERVARGGIAKSNARPGSGARRGRGSPGS